MSLPCSFSMIPTYQIKNLQQINITKRLEFKSQTLSFLLHVLYVSTKLLTDMYVTYNPAVTYDAAAQHQGRLFWIICNWLKLLKKAGRLQLIQNSAPSVALGRQCFIQIDCEILKLSFSKKYYNNKYCTRAIITCSWFETALNYKPRILDLKIEELSLFST